MGEIFATCFVVILFWCIPGLAGAWFIKEFISDDFNPLWKIPLTLIGPFSFAVLIFIGIYAIIRNYIREVKDYYADKRERKREEKLRHSYDDRIPERVIRELNRRD